LPTVSAQQLEPQSEPFEGVLVLRSGEILRGKITQTGDRHLVAVQGGEISVKSTEVDFCCRTIEEAYQRKKGRDPSDSVQDHLDLAQWCQRNGLASQATAELAEAKVSDPNHPMIPLLERRIKVAAQGFRSRPAAPKTTEDHVSTSELDRFIRGMPPGTVESFTQNVQPMLLNHCATAGCHGPGALNTFSLTRISSGASASRRITQRNLLAILQAINRNDPSASPLLSAPLRPHGTAKAPVFTDQQVAQYRQLADWVYRVSQMPASPSPVMQAAHQEPARAAAHVAAPAVYNAPEPSSNDAASPMQAEMTSGGGMPTAGMPAVDFSLDATPAALPAANPLGDRPGVKRGAQIPQFTPADPFDPQIFNRQFFPADAPPPAAEPSR
jgi:hypothetical protein